MKIDGKMDAKKPRRGKSSSTRAFNAGTKGGRSGYFQLRLVVGVSLHIYVEDAQSFGKVRKGDEDSYALVGGGSRKSLLLALE